MCIRRPGTLGVCLRLIAFPVTYVDAAALGSIAKSVPNVCPVAGKARWPKTVTATRNQNRLLNSIVRDCPVLRDKIETVNFPVGHEICAPYQPLKHIYFPTEGVLSTLVELGEGGSAESQTVGNEGMVGLPVWFGVPKNLEQVLQQADGEVARVRARVFCDAIPGHRHTERLLKRFAAYSLRFTSQNLVCNVHHEVPQRLCRWLLSSADRVGARDLKLTQNLLARMLGVRRQTVGEVALDLQRRGLISYRRQSIHIADRQRLESQACECYADMKRLYADLVGAALTH
jgi:CRP-like cAMP-binding protein